MARITVEDCLKVVGNRFELVHLAAKRADQIVKGGYEDLIETTTRKNKPTVMALREIAAGYTDFDHHAVMQEEDVLAIDEIRAKGQA